MLIGGLLLAWPWRVQADDTLRCGSRLVSTGMIAAKVEALCGKPSYRHVEGYELPRNRGYDDGTEIWVYNFGPNRLMQRLKFRDGRLRDIQSAGYGFTPGPPGHCGPDDIVVGMSQYQLVHECGEPVSRRAELVWVPSVGWPAGAPGWRGYRRRVYRERWVYNFGSDYFLRDVTLQNGTVTDVEDGGRGFANK